MNTTFFGGRLVKCRLLDESEAEFKVRQLPLGEYERAFALIDDEIGLTALICGHPKEWANHLAPESYEALYLAAQEVNAKGFFAWSTRRQKAAAEQQQAFLPALVNMTPEQIRTAVTAGTQLASGSSPRKPRP